MKENFRVQLSDIQEAQVRLAEYLPPTPLVYSAWLSRHYHCEVYLKLESMQPIGSFKIRGATNKLLSLTPAERKKGVIAASAGNHAQGVAWASSQLNVKATIVMPEIASITKIENTRKLGAEVILHGRSYDEAFTEAQRIAKKTGKQFVHAYQDPMVIAGQGTVGLEVLEQMPHADALIVAMGGGGLIAGIGTAVKALSPKTQIIGAQSTGSSALIQAIKKKRPVKLKEVHTFADGIAVGTGSDSMRKIVGNLLDEMITVDDDEISSGVLTLIEKAKLITEGAGAVPMAVLDRIYKKLKNKKVVLVICGGNIDVNLLSRIVDRGLVRAGRRLRLNVWIWDKPGGLAKVTQILAAKGANILQTIHDRDEPSTLIDQTEVSLSLEVRSREHGQEVIEALRQEVIRVETVS